LVYNPDDSRIRDQADITGTQQAHQRLRCKTLAAQQLAGITAQGLPMRDSGYTANHHLIPNLHAFFTLSTGAYSAPALVDGRGREGGWVRSWAAA
jgi:hypothetical protein